MACIWQTQTQRECVHACRVQRHVHGVLNRYGFTNFEQPLQKWTFQLFTSGNQLVSQHFFLCGFLWGFLVVVAAVVVIAQWFLSLPFLIAWRFFNFPHQCCAAAICLLCGVYSKSPLSFIAAMRVNITVCSGNSIWPSSPTVQSSPVHSIDRYLRERFTV